MAICGGCGAESSRIRSTYAEMVLVAEVCKACDPLSFEEHHDPTDNRIYTGPDAMPNLYKRVGTGNSERLVPTDELQQDTMDILTRDEVKMAEEKKRRTARREPLTATEIERANQWATRYLRPVLDAMQRNV